MNNMDVRSLLDSCEADLVSVETIIIGLGVTSNIVPYLTKYSIVQACGTIEQAFKSIIADHCERRTKKQVKRFLTKKVRESSANPSYDKICGFLKDFDIDWNVGFKNSINSKPNKAILQTSLQSLVDARNEFAHGGNPNLSIGDVRRYYQNAREIIVVLDSVVS